MKTIRTEVHITVATYIGDDIGEAKPPLSRTANVVDCVSLTKVSAAFPITGEKPHAVAKEHVEGLLRNAGLLAERISHDVRNLHIQPSE